MPDNNVFSRAELLYMEGTRHFNAGALDVARIHYLAALMHEPDHPFVLQNLGAVLLQMEKFEASLAMSRKALAVRSDNIQAELNIAVAQVALRGYTPAKDTFRKILTKHPDAGTVWHNQGLVHYITGNLKVAERSFETAKVQCASTPLADAITSDLSLTYLALEKIQLGLETYEVRWNFLYKSPIWSLNVPEWRGEEIRDKNILLHHEQGFGDGIMLARFAKSLHQLGANVTLAVPKELRRLFARNFAFPVVDWEDANLKASDYDYHSPLLSVIRWLGIGSPKDINPAPYLAPVPTDLGINLPVTFKIGICWASGDHSPRLRHRRRLVPLSKFIELAALPGLKLISLQKGAESADIVKFGAEGIVFDCTAKINDFAATSALMAELNLVITVDSAVAHLAGAMDVPCIMLSPYTRCWRWWNIPSGLPWYRNMKILSQDENGNWDHAMRQVMRLVREAVGK